MPRIESLLVLFAASAAMSGLPAEGSGQPSAPAPDATEADTRASLQLESRARKLVDRGGWAQAASLYVRAAQSRGRGDPAAPEALLLAGHLYFYGGQHEASVLAFRTAGQMLVSGGRVEQAAGAFRDGAWVATQAGLAGQAEELGGWTEVLTRGQSQAQPGQRRFVARAARQS